MKLVVAIPASVLTVEPSLQLKTIKVGLIARFLAIFRVDELHVYVDKAESWRDLDIFKTITSYMLVAPYLRRRVFPPSVPALRYAGMLPPLQLETHGVGGPRVGEIRQALVLSRRGRVASVEAGLNEVVRVEVTRPYSRGDIIHVKIEALEPEKKLIEVDPRAEGVYPGFTFEGHEDFARLVRILKARNCRMLATSRKGRLLNEVWNDVTALAAEAECLAILFGAPDRGLYEIASESGLELEQVADIVVNTIPGQGVLRVRTEEAIAATLAILNAMKARCCSQA
jgi:predicted SPOUT superfamily RNA methylase MTH1